MPSVGVGVQWVEEGFLVCSRVRMGSERLWFCFGHSLGVCWTVNIAGQVEIRVWSMREFPRHQFTSRDGHLGHESDCSLRSEE